jgi:hypothetical protein
MLSSKFMKIRSFLKKVDFGKKRHKFTYFHRFHFAASLSLDFDPYSKSRLYISFITLKHTDL